MTKHKSTLVVYLITGLSALLAVGLVYYYLDRRIADERLTFEHKYSSKADNVAQTRVVVVARDLTDGAVIGPDDVRVAEINSYLVKDLAVSSDPSAVVGKKTRLPLYAGEWILTPKLDGGDRPSDFSTGLGNGHRAIRVTVTATSGLLGLIEPLDRVDVIGIFPLDNNSQGSRTILQNVPVLAVGSHNPGPAPRQEGETAKSEPEGGAAGVTVTLDVSITEAEKLALATQAGKIHLVLRNRTDQENNPSPLLPLASLINAPRPVSAASPPKVSKPIALERTVTVVLGDKIKTEVVNR